MMLGREGNLIDGHVAPTKEARGSSEGSSGGEDSKKLEDAVDVDRKNADVV